MKDKLITMYKDDIPKDSKVEAQRAISELIKLSHEKPNVSKELLTYRKYVPVLLRYCEFLDKFSNVTVKTMQRIESDCEERKYERWTEEEDAALIELICSDRTIIEVSAALGRTVASIKTRVSKLVGIRRISQDVAGRFVGTADGQIVDLQINGTLYK